MKTQLFVIFIVSLIFSTVFSQTDVSGPYFSNEIWTQTGSPYRLVGDVQIPIGYSLTIEPGVVIEYTGQFEILIKGGIIANGTENDSIVFSCIPGISEGVEMLRFVDVDFSNSQISYSRFLNSEKTINIQGTCTETLFINSTYFSHSEIYNEGINTNVTLKNIHLTNMQVKNSYKSDNSVITIDSSIIFSSYLESKNENENLPSMLVNNSQIENSSFHAGSEYAEMELNNLNCDNCTFSTYYGKTIINKCKIINSGFNNHNTIQSCQVNFDIKRCFLINTSIESSVTNESNEWWSTINIDQCIISKNDSTILGYNVGNISNSIIIGSYTSTGIRILRGNLNNVTIVNNDVGIIREDDKEALSVTNSNILYNSLYNFQNNSSENISGKNNFWGETDIIEIRESIYDYYDDINLGEVDITNYLSIPNTDCPISPPRNIIATEVSGGYDITWNANQESDIAGYKLYYGSFDGFAFQYSIDIGIDTTYTIPNSIVSDKVAITAYDTGAKNSSGDMIDGHESWYSIFSNLTPTITSVADRNIKSACIIFPNPVSQTIKIQAVDLADNINQVDILNINGVVLFSKRMDAESIKYVDVSEYPSGVYFVKTIFENFIDIQKIIKN